MDGFWVDPCGNASIQGRVVDMTEKRAGLIPRHQLVVTWHGAAPLTGCTVMQVCDAGARKKFAFANFLRSENERYAEQATESQRLWIRCILSGGLPLQRANTSLRKSSHELPSVAVGR